MRQEKLKKNVFCPLVSRDIGDLLCEDIAYSSEGAIPLEYAPKEFQVKDWREICGNCKNHPN